jgi:anti-anti-sigma factor
VRGALAVVRELLDMDVAYVASFAGGRQRIDEIEGDAEAFGLQVGSSTPLEETFCARMVTGAIPNVIPDAAADPRTSDLATRTDLGIGAYVGVPVTLSDGRVHGSFCCLNREPDPELRERDVRYLAAIAHLVGDHIERDALAEEARLLELQSAGFGALLAALEARDNYTGGHSEAVVRLAGRVARRLGLPERGVTEVEQVALIHDVGKIGVPDALLRKQGPLSRDEWDVMRRHPVIGAELVAGVTGLGHLAPAVRSEHERWDGRGYPDGLAGDEIPLASRIVLACDAWHAMRSDRPYRQALSAADALRELEENAGTQFCPATAEALLAVVSELGYEAPSPPLARGPIVDVHQVGGGRASVVHVTGEIDMVTVAQLQRGLDAAGAAGAPMTLVDLAGVSYLDSAALSALVQAHRRQSRDGIPLALVNPSDAARALLVGSGLSIVFQIFDSVEDALSAS